MPTTRRRRARKAAYSPLVMALLAHQEIPRTPENKQELEMLSNQGYRESPTREYPFLVGWSRLELEHWELETH